MAQLSLVSVLLGRSHFLTRIIALINISGEQPERGHPAQAYVHGNCQANPDFNCPTISMMRSFSLSMK